MKHSKRFRKVCQIAIVMCMDIKDITLRKEKCSRLVNELLRFELKLI